MNEDRDDNSAKPLRTSNRDQFAGAARTRAQWIVASGHERKAARARHLDDRDPAGQDSPFGVDRTTEGTGDACSAT